MGQKHHFHRETIEKSDFWDLEQSPKRSKTQNRSKIHALKQKSGLRILKTDFGYWIFDFGYPTIENSTKFCQIQGHGPMDLKNLGWIWSKSMIWNPGFWSNPEKPTNSQNEFGVFLVKIEKSIPGNGFSILGDQIFDPMVSKIWSLQIFILFDC